MMYVVLDSAINFYLCFKVTLCQFLKTYNGCYRCLRGMPAKGMTPRRNHPKEIDERKKQLHVFTRFRVSCLFGRLAKIAGIEKGHLKLWLLIIPPKGK